MLCLNGGKGPCDAHGITYCVTCMKCANSNEKEKIYIRETSRNAYTASKEQLASLARKEDSSNLWQHSKDKHNERMSQVCMSVTRVFKNYAMLQQV